MSRRTVRRLRRPHSSSDPTRRDVLGALALATASTLAGCLGYQGGATGRAALSGAALATGPDTGAATIGHWAYDPARHGSETGAVFFLDRERALSFADAMPDATARKYAGYLDAVPLPPGVTPAAVRAHLLVHAREGPRRAAVLFGDVPDGSGTLDAGPSLDGEGPVDWRARDGVLVVAPGEPFTATLAAGYDGEHRWRTDSLVAASLDALGPGDDVSLIVHPIHDDDPANARFAGARVRGHRYVFGPQESRSRYVFGFDTEAGAARADVDPWLATARFDAYRAIEVRRLGRVVVIDGVLPTNAV